MTDFILKNWEAISISIAGPILTWFASRKIQAAQLKQTNAEADVAELKGIESNFDLYQKLIDDLNTRFQTRVSELEDDLERMKVINEEMRRVISDQEEYILQLKQKIETYEGLEEQD